MKYLIIALFWLMYGLLDKNLPDWLGAVLFLLGICATALLLQTNV